MERDIGEKETRLSIDQFTIKLKPLALSVQRCEKGVRTLLVTQCDESLSFHRPHMSGRQTLVNLKRAAPLGESYLNFSDRSADTLLVSDQCRFLPRTLRTNL